MTGVVPMHAHRQTGRRLPVLQVEDLRTEFRTKAGIVRAVDGVSFSVEAGEVLGIVGESGSGKSVTGFSIMGLVDPPGRVVSGRIRLAGVDILGLPEERMREIRGGRIAMIFQDPMTSLHPLLRVGEQMVDAIRAHRSVPKARARVEARDALGRVGIPSPEERLQAYPHQLSGGMRQRVAVAIALLNQPQVIIADEPTTALDVTTQGQILYEVKALCASTGTALVWITHDLAVVAGLADQIAVMYAGSIVEQGPVDRVLDAAAHPYSAGLFDSVPSRNAGRPRLSQIPGSVASAFAAKGCRFAPRCARADDRCEVFPALRPVAVGHQARCVHAGSQAVISNEEVRRG
ncbi:ABC transporter ATP-binding protein [Mesorhizobium sp. IMUNJ 23232]|uniref:ABC transporter ATP-binding protein n=1 Tax=Mesorhizobium sp. IMUNJ 23232 TaxID=3376064 RepID=UPI00378C87D8